MVSLLSFSTVVSIGHFFAFYVIFGISAIVFLLVKPGGSLLRWKQDKKKVGEREKNMIWEERKWKESESNLLNMLLQIKCIIVEI